MVKSHVVCPQQSIAHIEPSNPYSSDKDTILNLEDYKENLRGEFIDNKKNSRTTPIGGASCCWKEIQNSHRCIGKQYVSTTLVKNE